MQIMFDSIKWQKHTHEHTQRDNLSGGRKKCHENAKQKENTHKEVEMKNPSEAIYDT